MSFKKFSTAHGAPGKADSSSKNKDAASSGSDTQPAQKPAEGKPAPKS